MDTGALCVGGPSLAFAATFGFSSSCETSSLDSTILLHIDQLSRFLGQVEIGEILALRCCGL